MDQLIASALEIDGSEPGLTGLKKRLMSEDHLALDLLGSEPD